MTLHRSIVSVVTLSLAAATMALAMRPQDGGAPRPAESPKAADAPKAAAPKRDEAKRREIERLLELSGTRDAVRNQIDVMTKGFANMNLPPEMAAAMKEEFTNGLGEMIDMTIDVYDRNFSMEEVKAFVAFYESPTCQKISKIMPTVLKESTEAGMKWGLQMQPRLMKRMAALERAQAELERRFAGAPIPRPSHWGGYRVALERIEFWQGDKFRLHDRLVYPRSGGGWSIQRLSP
ncbi:MAG: pyridoxine 5'-phosphate oxidase C-terminal domain-containing protein [Gemmatimonadota bacterium]